MNSRQSDDGRTTDTDVGSRREECSTKERSKQSGGKVWLKDKEKLITTTTKSVIFSLHIHLQSKKIKLPTLHSRKVGRRAKSLLSHHIAMFRGTSLIAGLKKGSSYRQVEKKQKDNKKISNAKKENKGKARVIIHCYSSWKHFISFR